MTQRVVLPVFLGLAGLIPFVAAAAGTMLLPDILQSVAHFAVFIYGLVILAFLGGVHWGVALEKGGALRFVWSVIPALVGFFGALLPRPQALMVLAVAFAVAGLVDLIVFRRTGPAWYAALRVVLTVVVVAVLLYCASDATYLRVDPFGSVVRPN